ncbi:ParB/RepB/Spo0J family partition protein [Bosea thiooxidans]
MRDVLSLTSAPALPEHEIEIEIAAIDIVDRLRLVDRDKVEMIAASVSESYLHQPIAVAAIAGSNRVELVDGEHRLEAFKLLGRQTISARIRDLTETERRKHEIHANLIRNELNALDRIRFVGELAEIFAVENADVRNGGDRKSKKWREKNQFANLANWSSFSKEAARRTKLSTRTIDRTRELFGKLSPEAVDLIRGTKIAGNQAQLQALAEMDAEQQKTIAGLIAAKAANNIDKARIVAGFVPEGGAVRQQDQDLAGLDARIRRMSLEQAQAVLAMAQARIAALTPPAKSARAKRGGAE